MHPSPRRSTSSSMEGLTAPAAIGHAAAAAAAASKTDAGTAKRAAAAAAAAADDLDDFDDEDYFTSTYRPLSNLPTPPPSAQSSLVQSPSDQDGDLESSLLGPAVHLVNMLPPACSLVTPSVPLVQAMLTRAQLPINTVALAVCILDSLDARFARAWRLACPLGTPAAPTSAAGKRHTLPSPLTPPLDAPDHCRLRHIDAVFPEVIILAALVIAAKFDDDGHATQQPAQAYCAAWGSGVLPLWTGAQLATTERCIMQSLDYRILPLLDADLLADAVADMRRAGAQALRAQKARAASAAAVAGAAAAASAATAMATPAPSPPPPTTSLGLNLPTSSSASSASASSSASSSAASSTSHLSPVSPLSPTSPIPPANASLANVKRRHHIPSHSECLGRFTYEH